MPAFTSSTFNRYAGKWLIGTGILELVIAASQSAEKPQVEK